MRFDRVELRNFKPYADAEVDLTDGVTVIHGLNGSGKSSLLEACFFALYGANALDETLDEIVTTGAEEAEIDLTFTHDGGEYHVHRRLRATGERTTTADCVLEGPDRTVEGARDVERTVADLLRMDSEAFVNCAYVRQGEVNKLINATPSQRQTMIDDLLQLGRLETYRERAGEARLGVEDVLADARGSLDEVETQIEAKESTDPHDRLNALQSELGELDDEIENYEANRERARTALEEATDVLDEHETRQAELDALREESEELRETIEETSRERDELREEASTRRERAESLEETARERLAETAVDTVGVDAVEDRIDELSTTLTERREDLNDARMRAQALETQAENLEEKADDRAERASEKRDRADELEAEATDLASSVRERSERLDDLAAEVEAERDRFDDAPVDFGEAAGHVEACRERLSTLESREQDLEVEVSGLESSVEEAEELLAEGKCPTCGQPVADSPHVDGVDADRERLAEVRAELDDLREEREVAEAALERAERLADAESTVETLTDRRNDLETLLEERRERVASLEDEAGDLRAEASEDETQAASTREAAETQRERAASVREEVTERREEIEELEGRRDDLEAVVDRLSDASDERDAAERLRERRDRLAELNDERKERLAEKRTQLRELEEAVDESRVEAAEAKKANAEDYLERVEGKLAELAERRDELQNAIGGVKQDLAQLDSLRERRGELAARVDALDSLHDETEDLEAMYRDLRADLRQRNVRILERMLNETFDLVYGNDAYSHIRLDGDYELTVFQKDGTALAPEQLSGGERALFNLSLRCAIYRLLAEGIDGAAPMPPLILDEPTVFLDSGHVSRLVDLVDEMRDLGVRQIIIVSHDDELVGAADDLVRVEKDPTTNRSSVERADDPLVEAVADLADD